MMFMNTRGQISLLSVRRASHRPSTVVGFRASDQPDAPVSSGRKILKGSCIVEIVGKKSITTPMNPAPDASLQQYMEHASEHFANMQLPLGGESNYIHVLL